jgi:hypothetical protein
VLVRHLQLSQGECFFGGTLAHSKEELSLREQIHLGGGSWLSLIQ